LNGARLHAGAVYFEGLAIIVSQNAFRHLTSGGVSGAENQDPLFSYEGAAAINPGASAGRIPAKVSLAARASVTAGFANDVDEVNQ